jgi:putative heme-binding domain-containing protein
MKLKRDGVLLFSLLAFALLALPSPGQSDEYAQGKKIYVNQCSLCHGIGGAGGKGPALNQPKLARAATEADLLRVIREGVPNSEMPGFWQLNDKEAQQVVAYVRSLGQVAVVKLPGDATRGKALYETKGNCVACHVIRGTGGVSGPELTDIGARRSPAHLREAIVNPNAAVPDGYLVMRVTTADKQTIRGVRVNEDPFTIQLRDANNRFHSFRKAAVQEIKKEFGVSLMPAYQDSFTSAELDDLVAYLASLRGDK